MAGSGTIYRLDRSGHGVVAKWDDSKTTRITAETAFNEAIALGGAVADLETSEFVRHFDPDTQTGLLIVPQLHGG